MAEPTQTSLLRQCSRCGLWLTIQDFYLERGKYRRNCKRCHCADVKRRTDANIDAVRAYQAGYRAEHREEAKARTARYRAEKPEAVRRAQARYRADPVNAEIARARAQAFRLANPDRRREYGRRRYAAKKTTTTTAITPEQMATKFAYWGNRCWMCHATGRLSVDHVKPLAKGGAHVLCNLRPACRPCNTRKSDRWPLAEVPLGVPARHRRQGTHASGVPGRASSR